MRKGATLIAALLAVVASPAEAATGNPILGVWSNPKNSITVETAPCEGGLCGAIVHASEQAVADARDAGVVRLIGLQLLQNYRPSGARTWAGRVYVPDMGRTFSSRIEQVSPDLLKISGCLVGGFFCRSQLWHRLR